MCACPSTLEVQQNCVIWRPLENPRTLHVSGFQMQNPKGFGLVQRDRDFEHYQDLETQAQRRPSVWIVPRHDWGAGRVELAIGTVSSRESVVSRRFSAGRISDVAVAGRLSLRARGPLLRSIVPLLSLVLILLVH